MNKDFKKEKNTLSESDMFNLLKFWNDLRRYYDDEIYELLEEQWPNPPAMIKAFQEFFPRYTELIAERAMAKLDMTEKSEAIRLFDFIWQKERRMDINLNFFDWDEDEDKTINAKVPRKNRDRYKSELQSLIASLIYNRGSMFVCFYAERGRFEYMGVSVDDEGKWKTLTETELRTSYLDDEGDALEFKESDKVICFDEEKIKIMPANYLS